MTTINGLPTNKEGQLSTSEAVTNVDSFATVKAGHGAQILQVLEDHTYKLQDAELQNVLLKKEVRDLPVVVVSVAGPYRLGKSFLLNFFLRYLTSPLSTRQDGSWLKENSEKLTGFSWRGGSVRNTTGILMWSEPVVTSLPSGEKVAIILMDTQGTFDNESTVRDCSTIFALSTLLSSVQIYNLSGNIKEDDMQHLQLFTDYGKIARNESKTKPFQVLEFLVRDWSYFWEYKYGAEGGEALLQKKLEITKKTPTEMKELRMQLHSSFEKITAFLLPHPGRKVQSPDFQGNINDLEPEFRNHLIQLVESLFTPEKLMIKMINGEKIKSRDLYTYFKTYLTLFNSDDLPLPKNIMEATITASLLSSKDEAREVYTNGMDAECGPDQPSIPAADLQELHRKYKASARVVFLERKNMGSPEEANKYLEELIKELDEHLPQFEQNNNGKLQMTIKKATEAYEKKINNASNGNQLCLHPLDLEHLHKEGVEIAMKMFDANRKNISSTKDGDRIQFEQSFEKIYEKQRLTNELNSKSIITEIRSKYLAFMEIKCSIEPPLREEDFKSEHNNAIKIALSEFDSRRNRSHTYPEDHVRQNLITEIGLMFDQLNKMNISKYKAVTQAAMTHAVNEARQLYEKEMELQCGPMQPSMPDRDLETLHIKYLNLAKEKFNTIVTMGSKIEAERILQDLIKELEGRLQQYQQNNKSKYQTMIKMAEEKYENTIHEISGDQPIDLHPLDLQKFHQEAVQAAMKLFVVNRKNISSKTDDKRTEFEKAFEKRYKRLQQMNELNNKTAKTESLAEYSKLMELKCTMEPPLAETDFKREHENAMKGAIKKFSSKRNRSNSYSEDVYKQKLISEINAKFNQLNEMNKSKYKATVDALLRRAISKARAEYEKRMQLECSSAQPSMPTADLEILHQNNVVKAKKMFMDNITMNVMEKANEYIEDFSKESEERLQQYKQNNMSKYQTAIKKAEDAYEEIIDQISKDRLLCLHPIDLANNHRLGVNAAMKVFDANRKLVSSKIDNEKILLEKSFEKRLLKLKLLNELNNQTIIKEAHTEYWKSMQTKSSLVPPLSEERFLREHESARKIALNDFDFKRNVPNSYDVDIYRDELIKKITNSFILFKQNNTTKRLEYEEMKKEQDRNRAEQEKLKQEQERNKIEREQLKARQQNYEIDQAKIRQNQEKRIAEYEKTLRKEREHCKIESQRREKQQIELHKERERLQKETCSNLIETYAYKLKDEGEKYEQCSRRLIKQQNAFNYQLANLNQELHNHREYLRQILRAEEDKPECIIA